MFLYARPGERDRLDQGIGLLEDVLKRGGKQRGGVDGRQRHRPRSLSELLQSLGFKSKPREVLNPYLALCMTDESVDRATLALVVDGHVVTVIGTDLVDAVEYDEQHLVERAIEEGLIVTVPSASPQAVAVPHSPPVGGGGGSLREAGPGGLCRR